MEKERCYRTDARTPQEIADAVEALLAQMTLEEKIGQMTQSPGLDTAAIGAEVKSEPLEDMIRAGRVGSVIQLGGPERCMREVRARQRIAVEETRLGIPLLFCQDIIHGCQTVFPIPLAWSCSWNPELVEAAARVAAREAACCGLSLGFSPMVDIARDPRWGRVAEGAGEDPYLGGRMAEAVVRGYQGEDLRDPDTIAACLKHFLGYAAAEGGRDYNTCEFSATTLRNTYLPPFLAGLRAGAASLMTAFNVVDGVPAVANKPLLRDLLRGELGFDGVIISDYAAVEELLAHGAAEDEADTAKKVTQATLDIEMSTTLLNRCLPVLVAEGTVDPGLVEDAARRVLTLKYRLGLMEDPYRYVREEEARRTLYAPAHLAVSRDLAAQSLVLLKNSGVLPLRKGAKVALVGPFSESRDLLGCWQFSSHEAETGTIEEGLRQKGVEVLAAPGCGVLQSMGEEALRQAVRAAQQADVVVLCLGENSQMSGEAASRQNITLPSVQQRLAGEIARLRKPSVLLLFSGRPLVLEGLAQNVNALMQCWFPGSMGGAAIADVLTGEKEPCGRLSVTFPRHAGQIPLYYNAFSTGRPDDGSETKFLSKYIDGANEPLYPFGYGLSYTTFAYRDLTLSAERLRADETLWVSVRVRNTGLRAGQETVQLYLRDRAGSIVRPVKELKGFQRVRLEPSEEQEITFAVTEPMLRFYDAAGRFVSEPGAFVVMVGGSAADEGQLCEAFVYEG